MHSPTRRYVATVESVSTCPVNCEMCPVSRDDIAQPKAKLMSLDVAGAVAARLKHEFDVGFVAWGNWGEPLVHPDMVGLARAFARVGLTNQFLSSSLSAKFDVEAFVRSDIKHLDISISGITADVYNIGHKNGRWDLIERNMREVAEIRRKHPGALDVDIRWHRYRHNEHQLADARAFARELGFGFKPYYAHLGGVDALHDFEHGKLPESKRNFVQERVFLDYVQQMIARHRGETSCPMNTNLVIHSDGRLLHCCALMASHQDAVDFLTLPREALVGFKDAPNPYCAECLQKGWSGFTHSSKTGEDLQPAAPLPSAGRSAAASAQPA